MLFNSFSFAIFFPVVTILYFALPYRWRNSMLLVASCIFYCAFVPAFLLILWFTIVVDYFAARLIESATGRRRKRFLILSLAANIGVLAVFKYGNFLWGNVAWLGSFFNWQPPFHIGIMMPIGLSFHTFQAMSYTIEVYRGHQRAERHFWTYALYVMFYPQLVAGPIERPQHLLPQFREQHDFDEGRVAQGLRRMLWGFFKKSIADRAALLIDPIFAAPHGQSALVLLFGTVAFEIQLYGDFSSYCDIALGAAQVMGFRLVENFRHPFASRSPAEFWQRWHISLTTWFRDYVFLPLGWRGLSWMRRYANLLITFMLAGLWHGPNWTFAMWGVYYALLFTGAHGLRVLRKRLVGPVPRPLRSLLSLPKALCTFALVSLGAAFFRASTFADAVYIIGRLLSPSAWAQTGQWPPAGFNQYSLAVCLAAVVLVSIVEACQAYTQIPRRFDTGPVWVRWSAYYGLILATLVFGEFGARPFVYFQF